MRDRLRVLMALGLLSAVLALPTALGASDTFTDVPEENVFHDDIAWLAEAGVTRGCNPPDNTLFCPRDSVTREQMAAFMHRLATGRVVDAGTLEGKSASDLAPTITGVVAESPIGIAISQPTVIAEMPLWAENGNFAFVTSAVYAHTSIGGAVFQSWLQIDDAACSEETAVAGSYVGSASNLDGGTLGSLATHASLVMSVPSDIVVRLCAKGNIAWAPTFETVTLSAIQGHNGFLASVP